MWKQLIAFSIDIVGGPRRASELLHKYAGSSSKKLKDIIHALIEYFNPFSTNAPFMDKPGSWFLLAKCLQNTCGKETF